jgi:hypothetical protein
MAKLGIMRDAFVVRTSYMPSASFPFGMQRSFMALIEVLDPCDSERMHGENRFDENAARVHRRIPLNPFAILTYFP